MALYLSQTVPKNRTLVCLLKRIIIFSLMVVTFCPPVCVCVCAYKGFYEKGSPSLWIFLSLHYAVQLPDDRSALVRGRKAEERRCRNTHRERKHAFFFFLPLLDFKYRRRSEDCRGNWYVKRQNFFKGRVYSEPSVSIRRPTAFHEILLTSLFTRY